MGAAREFLRLSQQNLAAMDEPEAAAAAPQVAVQQAPPAVARTSTSEQQVGSQGGSAQAAKGPSMLPATSFLAMLQGKQPQGPAARPAERDMTAQREAPAQGMLARLCPIFPAYVSQLNGWYKAGKVFLPGGKGSGLVNGAMTVGILVV